MNKGEPNVGIDKIGFYVPEYYMDVCSLAEEQGVPVDKYKIGLGLDKMAVCPPDQDIISMGANAAHSIIEENDLDDIKMLIFCTESAFDLSKSGALFIFGLLKLNEDCRVFEIKQACYGMGAGLKVALQHVALNPSDKVLLVCSDTPFYEFNSPAEPAQGVGAVSLLITSEPRLLSINKYSGVCTRNEKDFWRPAALNNALMDGQLSCDMYNDALIAAYNKYSELTGMSLNKHAYFCMHTPFPRFSEKALNLLYEESIEGLTFDSNELERKINPSLVYPKKIGNIYTGSVFLSLISLLNNLQEEQGVRMPHIGLFTFGSGSIGEFYGLQLQKDYLQQLDKDKNEEMLAGRKELSYKEYTEFYSYSQNLYKISAVMIEKSSQFSKYRLLSIDNYYRSYGS